MKSSKLSLIVLIAGLFFACGTATEESSEAETTDAEEASESRYSYSNSFEMADQSYLELVRNWNNALVTGDFDLAFSYVADSLDIILADGMNVNADKDSMMVFVNQFLGQLSNIKVDFIGGLSVTSPEQEDTWVLSYTDESYTTSDGVEHSVIHELYRIEEGKIRSLYQYAQVPSELDDFAENQDGEYKYSGSFEMMDNQNLEIVDGWMDALVAQDWDAASEYLSDSITIIFDNGEYRITSRDSLISEARNYFEGATIEIDFVAAMAVKSTVQNDDWVLSWTNESYVRADTTERIVLHEVYQIVENKISFVRQFSRVASEEE